MQGHIESSRKLVEKISGDISGSETNATLPSLPRSDTASTLQADSETENRFRSQSAPQALNGQISSLSDNFQASQSQNMSLKPIIKQRLRNIIERSNKAESINKILNNRLSDLKVLLENYDLAVELTRDEVRSLKNTGLNSVDIYDKDTIQKVVDNLSNLKNNFRDLKDKSDEIIEIAKEPEPVECQVGKTTAQIQENINLLDGIVLDLGEKSKVAIGKIDKINEELKVIEDTLDDDYAATSKLTIPDIKKFQLEIYRIKGISEAMSHQPTSIKTNKILELLVNKEILLKQNINKQNEKNFNDWVEKIESILSEENNLKLPTSSSEIKLAIAKHAAVYTEISNRRADLLDSNDPNQKNVLEGDQQEKFDQILAKCAEKGRNFDENLKITIDREESLKEIHSFMNEKEVTLLRRGRGLKFFFDFIFLLDV